MEGLGVAANIVGILQLTATVIKYLNEVKQTSKDCVTILIEISSLYGLLFSLKELVDRAESGESWLATVRALGVQDGPLERFKSTLERLETYIKPVVGLKKAGRMLTWPLKKAEITEILHAIERQKALFILAIQNDHIGLSRAIEFDVKRIKHSVAILERKAREDSETKVLDWLSPLQPEKKHHDVRDRRFADTGQWLLQSEQFCDWCGDRSSKNLLWCYGLPGAGKTVLSSLVIDYLRSEFADQDMGLAFLYFDYRDQDDQSTAGMVSSLLKQLSGMKSPLPQPVLELHERFEKQRDGLQLEDLKNTLISVCREFRRVNIIVDALDECDGVRHRKSFLHILKWLERSPIGLFVTSRPLEDLRQAFSNSSQLEIEAKVSDIRAYLNQKLDEDVDAADLIDEGLKEEIIAKIVDGSQGMFLLPALQIEAILEQTCRAEIRQAIQTMPKALNDTFQSILGRISSQPKSRCELAMKTLLMISHARRPLQIDELREALAIRLGDSNLDQDSIRPMRLIIDSCIGLIATDNETGSVRLVHFSLQEYLQKERQNIFPSGESELASLCLTYLLFDIFNSSSGSSDEEVWNRLKRYHFLRYTAYHWSSHLRATLDQNSQELALRFLASKSNLMSAIQVKAMQDVPDNGLWSVAPGTTSTGLHVAASLGLGSIVKILIAQAGGTPVPIRDIEGFTPLHRAASNGHDAIVHDLLVAGMNADAGTNRESTPLFLAATSGHENTVRVLLQHGAKINAKSAYAWTALQKAADNGHNRVVEMLLDYGARIGMKSARGLTALHRASGRGHDSIVVLLLDRGADIETTSQDDWTPLHGAASSGRHTIVKILLDRGAHIHARSFDDRTPLHRACRGGHEETVAILLERGASVLAKDEKNRSPIHEAAQNGSLETVKRLLGNDASLQTQVLAIRDVDGRRAHHTAALSGHHDLSKYLRAQEYSMRYIEDLDEDLLMTDHGVVLHDQEQQLNGAATDGDERLVKKLLEEAVDVNAQNEGGITALHRAALYNHFGVSSLLLDKGANPHLRSDHGWTPLHTAAKAGNELIVQSLIEHAASIAATTNDGQTVLHKACQGGNEDTVRLLLQQHAKLYVRDNRRRLPLHEAAEYGHGVIANMLLGHGADLWARDDDGFTAQQVAAKAGQHGVLELLREHEWRLGSGRIRLENSLDVPESDESGGMGNDEMKLVRR